MLLSINSLKALAAGGGGDGGQQPRPGFAVHLGRVRPQGGQQPRPAHGGAGEQTRPAISSLIPDYAKGARDAVKLLMALIDNPNLPRAQRSVVLSAFRLVERGTTSSGDFGHVVARAREFIRRNACNGIGVPDVVAQVGVSRRLLEKRVREATGGSVLDMIQKVRLENVCRLLANTTLPISAVTTNSGYEPTSNLGHLFRRTYGMSMREFRAYVGKGSGVNDPERGNHS